MKKIILIRHGKSSWGMPVKDHERPLNNKGIKNSNLIFEQIETKLPERFLVWSSTAKRARDTAKIFNEVLNIPQELTVLDDDLYTFDETILTKTIKNCNDSVPSLIIFGHNNAITDFVNKFGNKFIENVPTSGVVIIEFPQENWNNINNGKTITTLFPKDLVNVD